MTRPGEGAAWQSPLLLSPRLEQVLGPRSSVMCAYLRRQASSVSSLRHDGVGRACTVEALRLLVPAANPAHLPEGRFDRASNQRRTLAMTTSESPKPGVAPGPRSSSSAPQGAMITALSPDSAACTWLSFDEHHDQPGFPFTNVRRM